MTKETDNFNYYREKSKQYDAYLIMIGLAYVKMVELTSRSKKETYQKVIDSLMSEIAKV